MKWEVCEWTECNTGGGEVIREYQGGGLPQLFLQSEGEEGGEKPEQEDLWERMEKRWLGQEFLGNILQCLSA